MATDRSASRWRFVVDNLNIHQSESLVRWVAAESDVDDELGEKGKSGILQSQQSRATFLSDERHRIVFHYTPKHSSWLSQIEKLWRWLREQVLTLHRLAGDWPTLLRRLPRLRPPGANRSRCAV